MSSALISDLHKCLCATSENSYAEQIEYRVWCVEEQKQLPYVNVTPTESNLWRMDKSI